MSVLWNKKIITQNDIQEIQALCLDIENNWEFLRDSLHKNVNTEKLNKWLENLYYSADNLEYKIRNMREERDCHETQSVSRNDRDSGVTYRR